MIEIHAADYIDDIDMAYRQVSVHAIQNAIDAIHKATLDGNRIYIIGNGGSASTASHFACDLAKDDDRVLSEPIKAIALTESVAFMTAQANDVSYSTIFSQQIANLVLPFDVVIAISGSGNSRNIITAIRTAKERNAVTIGLCGFDGGELAKIVDIPIVAPCNIIQHAEDVHLILAHLISIEVKALLKTLNGDIDKIS